MWTAFSVGRPTGWNKAAQVESCLVFVGTNSLWLVIN